MRLLDVMVIVVLVTLPFGFYRAYTRKFSVRWFLAIHLPVPLVFLVRFEAHLPCSFIPFTCFAFFVGQFLGAKAGRWWIRRRSPARAPQGLDGGSPVGPAVGSATGSTSPPQDPGVLPGGGGYAKSCGTTARSIRSS
jgi:hypothetical protein